MLGAGEDFTITLNDCSETRRLLQFFRHLRWEVGGYSLAEMLVGKRGTQGSSHHIFLSDFPAEPG